MFTDVTDLCDSEAEDGDLDFESTAYSNNTDFAERTLRTLHGCRVDGTAATIYLGAHEMARPGAPRRSAPRSLPEGILDDAGCGGEGRTRKATNGDARTAQFMAEQTRWRGIARCIG